MDQDMATRYQQVQEYKQALMPLLRYLSWLQQSAGTDKASKTYTGEGTGGTVMNFPVYDGALMSFVKEASKTSFMDRNYRYIYTRNRIMNHDDERRAIEKATIKEWDILCGILSKYVLGGRTKATYWAEAVQERIFFLVISKMCDIIEYWDKPIQK